MRSSLTRATKLLAKSGLSTEKVRFKHRHAILQQLEGTYEVMGYFGDYSPLEEVAACYWNGVASKYVQTIPNHIPFSQPIPRGIRIGQRLSQVLLKHGFQESDVAAFMEKIYKAQMVISCNALDIVRMSDSRNYRSCMSLIDGGKKIQLGIELGNPNVAVAFVKDKHGDYLGRVLLRLCKSRDESHTPILGLQKVYGNGLTHSSIQQALSGKIKCISLCGQYDPGEVFKFLEFSKHYNPIYEHQVWVDSSHRINKIGNAYQYTFFGKEIV